MIKDSDLYNLVEEFIMYSAFKEVSFYSPMNLTIEQEEKLWKNFSYFIERETGNNYINSDYKEKIIRCINLHNKAINSMIMDNQGMLHMKVMQNQHKIINDSLNQIIDTLNTETKLQDEDNELNFSVEQLEMIMKSYRFDINQLRKIQILIMCGIMINFLLMAIFILLYIKNFNGYITLILIFFFLWMAVALFSMFWRHVSTKVQNLESQIEKVRHLLWKVNFKLYKNQIETKYMKKDDNFK